MERAELWDRSRQAASQRLDAALGKLGHEWPSGIQAGAPVRPGRFFFDTEEVPQLIELLRERLPARAAEIISRAERILKHRFDLLGFEDLDYGKNIDWHLDKVHEKQAPRLSAFRLKYLDFEQVGDAKVTWELNRHQHLVILAKAYLLTGDERFARELLAQWYSWQQQNPYPIGINWASSLEVAFRSLSWLWVRALLRGNPALPAEFHSDLTRALVQHGRHIERYLSTYFSPNTHLLGEVAALFVIGTSCPEAVQSEHWRQLGWRTLVRESQKQVHGDGFYFEQSAYYHVYALELFLHSGLLAAKSDLTPPAEYASTVERMCVALTLLSRTGITASFGDDDGGRILDPQRNRAGNMAETLATASVVFGRGDFKLISGGLTEDVIWLLGREGVNQFDGLKSTPASTASVALEDSGLYLMSSADVIPQQLIIDAGPHGAGSAGHGHADALAVQLVYGDRVLLQDPGTFQYVGPGPARNALRDTAAHNTMTVDGRGQSNPVGPFAWSRLTGSHKEVWVAAEHFDLFCGRHDGYSANGITHRRWVFHLPGRFWLIRDIAEGRGAHDLELCWHLGPGLHSSEREGRFFTQSGPEYGLEIASCVGDGWRRELRQDWWSPVYGSREESWTIRCSKEGDLPAECATVLVPLATRDQSSGVLRSADRMDAPEVRCYAYEVGREQHGFFFRQNSGPWMHEGWASDAVFVYYRAIDRVLSDLFFYNGSYVEAGGRRIVSARNTVPYCQLIARGDTTQVVSPSRGEIVLHHSLQHQLLHTSIQREVVLSGARDRVGR